MNDFTVIVTHDRLSQTEEDKVKQARKVFPLGQIISIGGTPHISTIQFNITENNVGYDLRLALECQIREKIVLVSDQCIKFGAPKGSTLYVKKRKLDKIGVIEQAGKAISLSFQTNNEWTGVAVLFKREAEILKRINLQNANKLFLFEILNQIIFNGGVFDVKYVKEYK